MTSTVPAPAPVAPDAAGLVQELRASFRSGLTRPLSWRRAQLAQLRRLLREGEAELLDALATDLGKPAIEGWATDIGFVDGEIRNMERNLGAWTRDRSVSLPLKMRPGRARLVPEPLGTVLVIAPWNYPVQLLLLPMATAIAAGNCVVGKPSELAPTVSAALARLVPRYLDERAVRLVEGGVDETTALLAERWDHIFYTGNGRVGRVVMRAAAEHLTPVTLELGGKSPVIVDKDANLDVAARRIVWGKFMNAGQTCIAPDYVLAHEAIEARLVEKMTGVVRAMYGDEPSRSPDYGRIVNERHWRRLKGLLDAGGFDAVACGGDGDESTRYLAPTILVGVSADAAVMQEEIFGPILPVLRVPDVEAAIELVNDGDKPLALYVFSENAGVRERVIETTSSGGVCTNAPILHISVPDLPFGGVGESGMGAYHGRTGFDTLSHLKPVFDRPTRPDPSLLYPPFNRIKERLLRRFL